MKGVDKMSCIDYSMEVWNNNRINNLFGSDYYNNELALEVMKDEIMTNNYKLEKFYLNHKRELLSYKIKDLKKIFTDCSLNILHLINTDKKRLIISKDNIEYLDYKSDINTYILNNDIVFHTYVDDLDNDNRGIYIIFKGIKKYICDKEGIVYE